MLDCDPDGPLIICMSKVQVDKHGLIATGRIFCGSCTKKNEIFLLNENRYDTIQRIAIFMGQRREQVDRIPVGNIVAIEGLKKIKSGDTIIDGNKINDMVPFESVKYVTTPVVTVSLEPEYLRDLEKMKELIENMLIEDPNLKFEINEDNGEFLLSGMGPLHLEVTANEIEKRGVNVSISEPRAVFKESCSYNSSLITLQSPNEMNSLKLRLERLDEKTVKFFQNIDYTTIKPFDNLKKVLKEETNLNEEEIENFWISDEDQNIIIYNGKNELDKVSKSAILDTFEKIWLRGPLSGEKLTEIKIIIEDISIDRSSHDESFTELSTMLYEAVKKGLDEAGLVLLEPIYHTIIQLPPDHIKNVLSLLSKYSAKIKSVDQEKEYQAIIEILLSVRNSLKFAEDIRNLSSGKAFWQNEFYAFMEVPKHESQKLIQDLRFLKGLSW
jgi:elongation factor 2